MKKLLALIAMAAMICTATACSGEEHHDDAREDHHGHGHGEESDLDMSIKEIIDKVCEHAVPAHECYECRYEVGVVKVDGSLVRSDGNPNGLVTVSKAGKRDVGTALKATGEIRLNENKTAHISPRIDGVIHSVNVDVGDRVRKGEVLFTIESTEFGEAVGDYLKSLSMVELAEKTYERERSLFTRQISSEQEMLEARKDLKQERTVLKAAEQRLLALGLSEEDIERQNGDRSKLRGILPVRSPIGGTILKRHAVNGEIAGPGSDVMLVADLSTLWVWADIYESDLAAVLDGMESNPNAELEIRQAAFPGRTFHGILDYVGGTMSEETRTVKVRATVDNTGNLLRPGMFCDVNISTGSGEEVLAVPKSALLSDEGSDFIYKHLRDDYFVRRPVTRGREFAGMVEIREGLAEDELIVYEDAFLLKSDTLRSKMGAGCAD